MDRLEKIVSGSNFSISEKKQLNDLLKQSKDKKINIMITGAVGSGKSSTINAIVGSEIAAVGIGYTSQTQELIPYEVGQLTLWDTPGLGDEATANELNIKNILDKLNEKTDNGDYLIDLVLVLIDGSGRDLGTTYELLNNIIIPSFKQNGGLDRVLIAVNQADLAMKGCDWDYKNNKPTEVLKTFLNERIKDLTGRIFRTTGVNVEAVWYSAGYKKIGEPQAKSYNIDVLIRYIMKQIPREKRSTLVVNAANNKNTSNDSLATMMAELSALIESAKS